MHPGGDPPNIYLGKFIPFGTARRPRTGNKFHAFCLMAISLTI